MKQTNRQNDFYFIIECAGGRTYLRLCDDKNTGKNRLMPDFRMFTGTERELLREFLAHRQAPEYAYDFDGEGTDTDAIVNPDDRLIGHVLSAGLLRNSGGELLHEAGGFFRFALRIEDVSDSQIEVTLVLLDESGNAAAIAQKPLLNENEPPVFYTVSPAYAIAGDRVFLTGDLGPRRAETGRVHARLPKTDAPAFLSLVFSTFSNLDLLYEGWKLKKDQFRACAACTVFYGN